MNRVSQPPVQHRVQKSAEEHLFGQRGDGHSENIIRYAPCWFWKNWSMGSDLGIGRQPRKLSQSHRQYSAARHVTPASAGSLATASPQSARKDVAGDASPAHTWRPAWPDRPASCSARSPAARDSCSIPRRKCPREIELCKTKTKDIELKRNSDTTRTSPMMRRSRPLQGGFSAPGLIRTRRWDRQRLQRRLDLHFGERMIW